MRNGTYRVSWNTKFDGTTEIAYAHYLSNLRAFRNKDGIDYAAIAKELNDFRHEGEKVRTEDNVRRVLAKYATK